MFNAKKLVTVKSVMGCCAKLLKHNVYIWHDMIIKWMTLQLNKGSYKHVNIRKRIDAIEFCRKKNAIIHKC